MNTTRVVVVGGGAAGFLAAITTAEARPDLEVLILERSPRFLAKVRISGGGRCNVTHACFNARELAQFYPRGGRALIGPFERFQPRDTIAWFAARGVTLKTEPDGRLFPTTDSSATIVDCLLNSARNARIELHPNRGLAAVRPVPGRGFALTLSDATTLGCEKLLLATGGCRAEAAGQLAVSLGHTLQYPVPSLFTFQINLPWLRTLAGVSLPFAEVSAPALHLRDHGPVLFTHWGLSGPAILRMSAWGARKLHQVDYRFALLVNWLPGRDTDSISRELAQQRAQNPARLVVNTPVSGLPARLWEQLVLAAGLPRQTRWAELSRPATHQLVQYLIRTELPVSGKSLNKDEFVTCGGVPLRDVDLRTMESRVCRGLYLAGELLDIDGLTGGFNFQAAWTTGWLAGQAMSLGSTHPPITPAGPKSPGRGTDP
jgi:predicted Rossmann fold flavoprotein